MMLAIPNISFGVPVVWPLGVTVSFILKLNIATAVSPNSFTASGDGAELPAGHDWIGHVSAEKLDQKKA